MVIYIRELIIAMEKFEDKKLVKGSRLHDSLENTIFKVTVHQTLYIGRENKVNYVFLL